MRVLLINRKDLTCAIVAAGLVSLSFLPTITEGSVSGTGLSLATAPQVRFELLDEDCRNINSDRSPVRDCLTDEARDVFLRGENLLVGTDSWLLRSYHRPPAANPFFAHGDEVERMGAGPGGLQNSFAGAESGESDDSLSTTFPLPGWVIAIAISLVGVATIARRNISQTTRRSRESSRHTRFGNL